MGGGDLNMKKSWHPLLMKNQERVWKEERKALEERKKTAQLQKELAEERQLQELQRIQAAQGGGVREERVDWLYATPAVGTGINTEEQEAYLLGKKTVDKLFKEKDEAAAKLAAQVASQADADKPGGGFISLQNANTTRDLAAKIREDPLLAIKQQEQLALENLRKNPTRLKALQSQVSGKEERRKEKEARKQEKRERKERKRRQGSGEHDDDRSDTTREPLKRSRYETHRPERSEDRYTHHRRSSPDNSRHDSHRHKSSHEAPHFWHERSTSRDRNRRHGSPSPPRRQSRYEDRDYDRRSPSRHRNDKQSFAGPSRLQASSSSTSQYRKSDCHDSRRTRPSPSPPRRPHLDNARPHNNDCETAPKPTSKLSNSKAAKLAQMEAAAKALDESRSQRLKQLDAEDQKKLAEEELERERNRIKSGGVGDGTRAKFVRDQEKKVFFGEMGLGERVKRSGGVGLMKDRE